MQKTDPAIDRRDRGFTLIELIVIVLIAGVLAAIAIPTFLTQSEGAHVSKVQSDIRNARIAVESFAVQHSGGYEGVDPEALREFGYRPSDDIRIEVVPEAGAYTITAESSALPARSWTYSSVTGSVTE